MSVLKIETVDKNGKPAKSRFTDPSALRSVYDTLTRDDMKEADRRGKLKRLYDGNLPYDVYKLKQSGLKHVTNVNWLGLKSVIDNRADTLLRLSCDTANLIELQPLARELAGPDAQRIASVVADEFSKIIRETGRVIPALSMMNREADLYGLGPVTWTSSIDYNPVALERGQIRFVSDGPVNSSDHELFMFETTLPASYMFFLLDHQDIAEAEGWDIPTVKEWLVRAFRDDFESKAQPGIEGSTSIIESRISLIRQNRFEEEHQFKRLHVIHAFIKEMAFPRGITHIIMPAEELKTFMFRKTNAYQTMDQCFLWFPSSVNERYARAVRGIASFLYPIEMVNNRYKCRAMDLAFQNASLIFSQQSAGAQQNLTLNEQGPFTVVPKELQPVQNNVKPDMNMIMAFSQFVDNLGVNSVTGSDKAQLSQTGPKLQEGTKQQTKLEAELQQRLRSRKEEALFVQRMSVLDKVFRETFSRFIRIATSPDPTIMADYPEALTFVQRCSQRGVGIEVLMQVPQFFTVCTCRDLVLGSEGKVGVLTELLGTFGGNFDEAGRKAMQRDIVQLRLGSQAADKYASEVNRDQAPSDQASFATLENNMMKMGMPAMVGQDQMHWSHIPIHSQILQEIVEQVKAPQDNMPENEAQGGLAIGEQTLQNVQDPKSTLRLLEMCSQHIQEHLGIGAMQIGMQDQAKQVQKMLQGLRPTVKALNLAIATQERVEQAEREKQEREMQELQQRADENDLRKAQYEVDKKAEVDRYRVDRDHEVAMHKLELEGATAGARSSLEAQRQAGDEERRNRESESKISAQNMMAQARVNAANSVSRAETMNAITGGSQVTPGDITGQSGSEDDLGYMSL